MNKQVIITAVLFLMAVGLHAQTKPTMMNNFESQWKQVEKFEKDDLPKSAMEVVDGILNQAIADKNTQQVIKSLLVKNKYRQVINYDDNTQVFADLEKFLTETADKTDKSILHSLLGEMYLNYYQGDAWTINRRTDLVGFVPDDIKEWTKNIFFDKAKDHFRASVQDKSLLISKSTSSYNELIVQGKNSGAYYPTLYDFLMNKAIIGLNRVPVDNLSRALSAMGLSNKELAYDAGKFIGLNFGQDENNNDLIVLVYYQKYLSSLLERNLTGTIILTELSRISYIGSKLQTFKDNYTLNCLTSLFEKYKSNPVSVETISSIIDFYNPERWEYLDNYNVSGSNTGDLEKAYSWAVKGIELYPSYERVGVLIERLYSIEKPDALTRGNEVFHPGQKNKILKVKYRNLKKVEVVVKEKDTDKLVKQFDIQLAPKTSYLPEETEINLDFLGDPGEYEVSLVFDDKESDEESVDIYITRIAAFGRVKGENEYEFYVVDRLTGEPLKDAVIHILYDSKPYKDVTTDAKGFATYISDKDLNKDYSVRNKFVYTVSLKNDNSGIKSPLPYSYAFAVYRNQNSSRTETEKVNIFTDRSIYRPGQTVYFKGVIAQVANGEYVSPIISRDYTVKLYDTNYQLVSEKRLRTNEFGSLSGEFVLPQGGLTGSYQIEIDKNRVSFSVEEYKRPTFQITFDKIDKTYAFGDKVVLKGLAENFSGVKLQDATVEYSITKTSFWRWYGNGESIESGSVKTMEDGSFEIAFTIPVNEQKNIPFWRSIYSFNVSASVTDINGETQTGSYSFAVGEVSMVLSANIADKVDKEANTPVEFKAVNLNGQDIPVNGNYVLYSYTIQANDTIKKEMLKGSFVPGEQKGFREQLRKLESGRYMLKLTAKDSNNKDVESENIFVLYSANDKKPPVETNEWMIRKSDTFAPGKNAEFILGVSAKNATVLYELIKDEKIFERRQVKLNNENKAFVIPYKEEYGDNVYAVFTYVIDEVYYQQSIPVSRENAEKNLKLKLEVFRDKLRPGQQEEWRISVKDNADKPALAELLASMYDSSLDKLRMSQNWAFTGTYKGYSSPETLSAGNYFNNIYLYIDFKSPSFDYPDLSFDYFNWFGFSFNDYNLRMMKSARFTGAAPSPVAGASADVKIRGSATSGYGADDAVDEAADNAAMEPEPVSQQESATPQIRQNFNETAFFYPQLRTNENGETIISFTVPESNTTWKFRALAYDKSFNTGTLEAMAVSRKELMVTPNLPRFMRQGDKTSISTKISNLSEGAVSGNVRIEFFDPATDKVVNLNIVNQVQSFSVKKDGSESAVWSFEVPADIDMIGCRMIAESEAFSDGEQHIISVLPDRMLVTESMTMNVNGQQTKNFTFDKFANNKSNTLSNYRLTLEYASNPAWYAVQALPSMSNPTNENAVNWFASYYVNTLGSYIVNQYPKVSAMINTWKKQGETKETLVSKLMKNEELKTVLLEETPWVLDAKDEMEQMQKLSLLFDLNNSRQQTTAAIAKLSELQNSDGGWSWYKGFRSGPGLTQYILYGFTELVHMNVIQYPENIKRMQMNAIRYIDEEIKKDFANLKKYNKDWQNITGISNYRLEYIFVRSGYRDIPIDQEAREAERFYTSVAEKNWTKLTLYQRSILVPVLKMNGNKELAEKIMKSLRERATVNEEMGMYWANNKSNVFLTLSAVSAHAFIMEAFREMGAPDSEMDMMKQWLLKQKQTQVWESTHATIDAIYAMLSTGSDWFTSDGDVKITVNKQLIEPENKEAGTGYFKQSWEKGEITPDMGNVTVTKSGNGPSYGAMYWQYYENLDLITEKKGELNVDKMLFVERSSDKGKSLNQITEESPLKVGDKVIIRLTVRADRNMEFVHLKDMRASCFEPVETLSGTKWQNRTIYYQSVKDASTNFYFDHLAKGTYVFEYPVYVNRTGEYSNGITTIQCMYAPEFVSHTKGIKVVVK